MNCLEAEQQIQKFIEDDLTGEPLANFIRHIDSCHSCYEEMETSYLLKEVLSRLENGETFDLHKELAQKLSDMKQCLEIHKLLTIARRTVSIIASILIAMSGLYLLFEYYIF